MSEMEGQAKNLNRIPRSLTETYNYDLVERLNELGGSVMMDIIIFLSGCNMKDLFGNAWFSIKEFCDIMGYERTHLQRRLSPEQISQIFGKRIPYYHTEIDGHKIDHPIETVFEAALYRLGKENISIPTRTKDGTKYSFVQIINSFDIKTDFRTKKGTQRLYCARLSEDIKDTLFTHYNLIELSEYKQLSDRKGFRYFYLNLSKMIYLIKYKIIRGEAPNFKYTVDQLAKIFDVNVVLNKERKRKITAILNTINESLTVTKYQYEYVKNEGDKWAYTVSFYFPEDTLSYFDEKFNAVFTSRYYDEMKSLYAFCMLNIKTPLNAVKALKELLLIPEEKEKFNEWFYSDNNKTEKEKIYKDTFLKVFGKMPEEMGAEMGAMLPDVLIKDASLK
jgi:hypothetical protein